MSLDGFIATPDHGLEWLDIVKPPEGSPQDYGYAEFMRGIDTVIIGRNTYEKVSGFPEWPYTGKTTRVLSNRPIQPQHGEKRFQGSLGDLLDELENSGSHSIYLEGGQVVQQALACDAVTRMTVSVIPVLLGSGIPLFGNLNRPLPFRLEEVRKFGTGLVQLIYRPCLAPAP